jgi:hypothetical protein
MIKRAPYDNLTSLAFLIQQSAKHNRKQAESSISALRDTFLTHYLTGEIKMQSFPPKMSEKANNKELLNAYISHHVLQSFRGFIKMLDKLSGDNLEFFKKFATKVLGDLAPYAGSEKDMIINTMVNKLGDSDKKVACQTIFVIGNMLNRNPELGELVIRSISILLSRNLKPLARYYAHSCLTKVAQICGKHESTRLALIKVYFAQFKQVTGEHTEVDEEDNKVIE